MTAGAGERAGEEEQGGEVRLVGAVAQDVEVALMNDVEEMGDAEPFEEVAVIQMEIPNFQIDQATSLQEGGDLIQSRGEGEARDRKERATLPMLTTTPKNVVVEVDKERKQLKFLDSVKIAKRNIDQKKASLERMKQEKEVLV